MGRPRHSKQYDKAGPLRRFLFYIFENLAFEPGFDQALEYHDAIAFARHEPTCLKRPWDSADRTVPLRRIHEQLQREEIEGDDGFSRTQVVGKMLPMIVERFRDPRMQKKLRIHRTHLLFDADQGRPPTFNELRFVSWYCHSKYGKENFDGHFNGKHLGRAYRGWLKEESTWRDFMDRGQFTRTVREMGISLFDGSELSLFKRHYDALKRRLNRKPSVVEYVVEIEQKIPSHLPTLSEKSLDELVNYLSSPTALSHFARWNDLEKTKVILEEFLSVQGLSGSERKRVTSLVTCLFALDVSFEIDRLAPLFDGIQLYDRTPMVRRSIEDARLRLSKYPDLSDFLRLTDGPTLKVISHELRLPKEQAQQLQSLAKAIKLEAAVCSPPTIAKLATRQRDMKNLVMAASKHYRYRTAGLLWYEFSTENGL